MDTDEHGLAKQRGESQQARGRAGPLSDLLACWLSGLLAFFHLCPSESIRG
jgi:hypothetical protein